MPKKKECWTLAVIIGLLALCCAAVSRLGSAGKTAAVYENGVCMARLPLSADQQLTVSGNTIQIRDGACCVLRADCPDQRCVHQGWASRAGQCIVCLPNRVMIQIEGGNADADTVSY